MTKEQFIFGWRIFILGIGKNPDTDVLKDMAITLYQNIFYDRDGDKFKQACIKLAKEGVISFSPARNILDEMRDISSEYDEERDWDNVTGMPPELRVLLNKMKDDKGIDKIIDENERKSDDDRDLPF